MGWNRCTIHSDVRYWLFSSSRRSFIESLTLNGLGVAFLFFFFGWMDGPRAMNKIECQYIIISLKYELKYISITFMFTCCLKRSTVNMRITSKLYHIYLLYWCWRCCCGCLEHIFRFYLFRLNAVAKTRPAESVRRIGTGISFSHFAKYPLRRYVYIL